MDFWAMFPDLQWSFPIDQEPPTYSHDPYGAIQSFNELTPQPNPPYCEQLTTDSSEPHCLPELPHELLLHGPQDVPSLDDVATSTVPPPKSRKRKARILKSRKRKARTLRDEDFKPYKARILELHVTQGLPLGKVRAAIEEEFGFVANERQYRTRITQWGQDKNIKKKEMGAIVRKQQQRNLVDIHKLELSFTVRGRVVPSEKIYQWMTRHGISWTSLYAPSSVLSTPSAVCCRTISERGSVVATSKNSTRILNLSPKNTALAVQIPAVRSLSSSVRSIVHLQNTSFTGQSPAPVHQAVPTPAPTSRTTISNPIHDTQLPRRHLQDEEEHTKANLSVSERLLGPVDPQTLDLRIKLGRILCSQGRYKSAEKVARRTVEDSRENEINGLHLIRGLELLGTVLRNQGSSNQAHSLQKWVFESKKAILGEEHPSTLSSMTKLSWVYMESGSLKEAEEICVLALEISKRVLGESHLQTTEGMHTLASIHYHQGRWEEAEALAVQSLEIKKRKLGNRHAQTVLSMSTLATVYFGQGRLKEAEELEMQTLESLVQLYGDEHPLTLEQRYNLASTYTNQGRFKEAEDLGVRVLVAMRRVLGERHPDTIETMDLLMKIYEHQGQLFKAEELKKQKLELQGE